MSQAFALHSDTVVAIFAKYPTPGKVKTRLSHAPVPGLGQLSLDACATLYEAFLQDYIHRFATDLQDLQGCFCLRPGPHTEAFSETYGQGPLSVLEEPGYDGRRAQSIGEAMSFTIRYLLDQGAAKVIILGSDLPHLPGHLLREARQELEQHPLVLGDDGGGCYLVAGAAPPFVLEQDITWSQNTDFAEICERQRALGESVGILSAQVEDLDQPQALARLLIALQSSPSLVQEIPHTAALLKCWQREGLPTPTNT